jgi:ribosomal protein S18 acetylase RimI-like enzyme
VIEPAPFDSDCYGLRIGRVAARAALTREPVRILDAARDGGYAMVYARMPDDAPLARALASEGHVPVDTLVTSALWTKVLHPVVAGDATIEQHAQIGDAEDLDAIAHVTSAAITRTRFHADPRLPHDATILLVEAWAKNDARGRAQRIVLARRAGRVIGYLAALETPERVVIDLVAVHPSAQGRGIGGALLASFIDAYVDDTRMLTVGTQHDNPALALYKRHGFKPMQTEVTFHLWT